MNEWYVVGSEELGEGQLFPQRPVGVGDPELQIPDVSVPEHDPVVADAASRQAAGTAVEFDEQALSREHLREPARGGVP